MNGSVKRIPVLDPRLELAFQMGVPCTICADIGADHGRLSAVLLASGSAQRVLIADISDKALEKARRRIKSLGLNERAVFAVANGLDALDALGGGQADTIFILGMGGDTMAGILRRGSARLKGAALVLSAQTELPLLRAVLCEIGYRIRREDIAVADGRSYIVMRCTPAQPDEPDYGEDELLLGPVLKKELPAAWLPMLKHREGLLKCGLYAMEAAGLAKDIQRHARFERELGYVSAAIAAYPHSSD